MRTRIRRGVAALSLTVLVAVGSGCAGGAAKDTARRSVDDALKATGFNSADDVMIRLDLAAYRERCGLLDIRGGRARVLYRARRKMTRGDSETVTAAVTLNQELPANEVLGGSEIVEEAGILVSCRLQAQLRASHNEFDIEEEGWSERSVLTTDTARWSWSVTPKVGGTNTLVLYLRPIMKVKTGSSSEDLATKSNVQQYETSVHVDVPWTEWPLEAMSKLAAALKVAESLVKALTLLVVALTALGTAFGLHSRKKKRGRHSERAVG